MRIVAVHAAIADQAHQMNALSGFLGRVHGMNQRCLFKERPVLNVLGDTGQLLIDDTARTDVEVADLAVAHLAIGQTHVHTACTQFGVRIAGHERVQPRRALLIDRIALMSGVDAEAVHDDKGRHGFLHMV